MRATPFLLAVMLLFSTGLAPAGPFDTDGIEGDDPSIIAWATGWVDYEPALVGESWDDPTRALGAATGNVLHAVSLGEWEDNADGDPGRITMTFDVTLYNGGGPDFAVFENAFPNGIGNFAELAFVEVSTDGVNFQRFPNVSLNDTFTGAYASIDPSDIYNLPGALQNGYGIVLGTPFDFDDLLDSDLVLSGDVDLSEIHYIRLIDIPGNGDFHDTASLLGYGQDNPIYDPYPTTDSSGFDLEALGVIHGEGGIDDDDDSSDDDDATDDDDDDDYVDPIPDDDDDTVDDDDDDSEAAPKDSGDDDDDDDSSGGCAG